MIRLSAAPAAGVAYPTCSKSRRSCPGWSGSKSRRLSWHGDELSGLERRRLVTALARARVATAIWRGERTYPDRSTRHFAFAAALIRAGLNRSSDHDLIAAGLMALDVRLGAPADKVKRPDYLARTIAAAMARTAK